VGAVTSQRVLKVLFYVNILQCFFVAIWATRTPLMLGVNSSDLHLMHTTSGVADITVVLETRLDCWLDVKMNNIDPINTLYWVWTHVIHI
jgi:hypothetical protein